VSNLFPTVDPIPVPQADTPYTGKLVWLSFSPNLSDPKTLDASAHIRTAPYRVLDDGTIDVAPEQLHTKMSFASITAAAGQDPKLAAAVGTIAQAIKDYMGAQ
jgi:hypothetical protein